MLIREGLIPTVVGTAVTATGIVLKDNLPKTCSGCIIGFGLAHVLLGSIDLVSESVEKANSKKKFKQILGSINSNH